MAREALERIREEGGEEGFTLANTLIRTFGGVGKGIDDRRVVLRLADEVEEGRIRLRDRVFIYRNSRGRDMVFGAQGDTLLDEVVGIAAGIHGDIAKKRHLDPIEDTEVRSGILSAVRQVSYELERRARVRKLKAWFRNALKLS
ncbi:MAG: hypothetical protein ACOY3M_02320 [Patescibacteria group bacterium]